MAREQTSGRSQDGEVERRTYLRACGAMAALGGVSLGLSEVVRESNTLTVVGDAGRVTNYEVAVTDSIRPLEAVDSAPTGRATEDAILGGSHQYAFEGELTSLRIDGPAAVFVNGHRVSPNAV